MSKIKFFSFFSYVALLMTMSCSSGNESISQPDEPDSALLMTMSCSSGNESISQPDEPDSPINKPKPILLTCNIQSNTRVTDTGYESGDKIGLYVVNYAKGQAGELQNSGNHVDNMAFTYSGTWNPQTPIYWLDNITPALYVVNYAKGQAGELQNSGNHVDNMAFTYSGTWNPQTPIYWLDNITPADFYAYHPYADIQDVTAHSFQVNADQSTADRYKASDFLYGKALKVSPTNTAVSIQTRHLLSSMVIKVTPGNGFTAESLAKANVSVKLNGHLHTALINLKEGTLTAKGEAGSTIPYKEGDTYKALVIPQTVTADNFITVTVDNREFKLNKSFTFIGGKRHVFTVTVKKTSNGINVGVTPWEDDGVDHGGTAE